MTFSSFFSEQARKPSGWFGRLVMPIVFDRGNAFLNRFVEEAIAIQSDDRVLEIGCGTGGLIKRMAATIENGHIEGIDFSPTMVAIARRRNRKRIAQGAVTIAEGNFDAKTYPPERFTKACSVNTIYFWKRPQDIIDKAMQALIPGGQFVVAFEDMAQLEQRQLSGDVFRLYSTGDVRRLFDSCALTQEVGIQSREKRKQLFHCAVATRSMPK